MLQNVQTRTRRQKEVLDFITRYIEGHGYEPSYQLIARHLGVSSKAGIAKHIKALEDQGLLKRRRENGSFSLEIPRFENRDETLCMIDWLDVPLNGDMEPWAKAPLTLPGFLLGNYAPSKVFAFVVPDDSLAKKNICEGDIALIEERSFVRDGDCAVAVIQRKTALLKMHYRDGSMIELRSANDEFETLRLAADKVEIRGVFRGLIRPLF